jgi:putative membrane protein
MTARKTKHIPVEENETLTGVDLESRARTHLANERTFLAWLRTGIAMIALGLAAAQFLAHDLISGVPLTRTLSILLIATGLILTLAGARRYRRGAAGIESSQFRPATTAITIAVAMTTLVAILSVVFVLSLRR